MLQLSHKRRKKALLKNGSNLESICEKYYALKKFENVVFERSYVVERHQFLVQDILKEYGISSVNELMFLLHKYCGDPMKECEFCGHIVTKINTRNGINPNIDDCGCRGICIVCEKTYHVCNDDGVCYRCKPPRREYEQEEYQNTPEMIHYKFLSYVGNYQRLHEVKTIDEAQKMMHEQK